MDECPQCEFPIKTMGLTECPKCDYSESENFIKNRTSNLGILEVDIAHSGETWEQAKVKLDKAIDDTLYYGHSGLKVIHGWGSTTGGVAVIGPRAQSYLQHIAEQHGGRFTKDHNTSGASLIWFNR